MSEVASNSLLISYICAFPCVMSYIVGTMNNLPFTESDLARRSCAVSAYVHANKGVPEDWRQWHVIRDCIAGRFCMAARTIKQIAGNPLEDSLKKVNFRLDRIESRLAVMKTYTE